MKKLILSFFVFFLSNQMNDQAFAEPYNCNLTPPEIAGFHNMVVFGDPDVEIYAYHLPLFEGEVHGVGGHVLMHVYQGLWSIKLNEAIKALYKEKFLKEKSFKNPIPFFSLSPREKPFKVPDLICNKGFKFKAFLAYGHVEKNRNFPAPERLLPHTVSIEKKGESLFARRFDKSSKEKLTYILFGKGKALYLAHYLTDDENSFDQIVSLRVNKPTEERLGSILQQNKSLVVTVDLSQNPHLEKVMKSKSSNNGFKFSVGANFVMALDKETFEVKVESEVYYNKNRDLQTQGQID